MPSFQQLSEHTNQVTTFIIATVKPSELLDLLPGANALGGAAVCLLVVLWRLKLIDLKWRTGRLRLWFGRKDDP